MFEGKHIHFSPTDNKPLCSYSGKLCRQRRLNGYAFCIRHILEDKSAPFKQCSYVTRNNSQKCLNAIPSNQDRGYCHSHMQVVGIIPKTERKSKTPSVSKADSNSSISSNGSDKSSSPISKKDPGAVFKFEEESSDITDVFSYKNGLANVTLNGKNKGLKAKDCNANSMKDGKNGKPQNGFSYSPANFTTKKVTDKNRNVYTAIIPTGNSLVSTGKKASNNKAKNGSYNGTIDSPPTPPTQQRSSSYVVNLGSGFRSQKYDNIRKGGRELKKLQDADEIRQFEHLKTLKQLDRSSIGGSSILPDDNSSCDAKFKIFPRLAAVTAPPKEFCTSMANAENGNSSSVSPATTQSPKDDHTSSPQSSPERRCKSEIVCTPPVPPLITRSNNGIIIKTEPQREVNVPEKVGSNANLGNGGRSSENVDQTYGGKQNDSSPSSSSTSEDNNDDHCSSIDSRNINHRQEFLARVRNTFKSQYTSIKKACKVSEKYEQDGKQKFRDSLIRCVRIDSSICAQVLVGNGSKFSAPVKMEAAIDACRELIKREVDAEYDDYEFFDNDILSSSSVTKACTAIVDYNSIKSRKCYSNGKKNSNGESKTKIEDKKIEKIKSTPKRSKSSGKKGTEPTSSIKASDSSPSVDKTAQSGTATPKNTGKNAKRVDKRTPTPATECVKIVLRTPPSKRRLKRTDAIIGTGSEDSSPSTESIKDNSADSMELSTSSELGKRRRFCSSEMITELGLTTINGQHSPSTFELGDHSRSPTGVGLAVVKCEKIVERGHNSTRHLTLNNPGSSLRGGRHELHDILGRSTSISTHRNQGLETVLNSVGSSENASTPDGVITDASFDSTFEHSTSSQPDCEFSEDDLEHSFELQIDPEIENQASRLLEDNVLTEADFTELFPDNRMSDHKFGRNDLQELGMAALDFDVNDIDYSLFANIFPNFPRTSQPESISISNPF